MDDVDDDRIQETVMYDNQRGVGDLERLLKRGEDPNQCDAAGRSLLVLCVCPNVGDRREDPERLKKVELLIQYGADVNAQDARGWSVAHACAWSRDLPLLEQLAKHGADFSIVNCNRETPADLAFMKKYTEVCDFLDRHTLSLKTKCRCRVRAALGRRVHSSMDRLPVPPSVKLFINYRTPYPGWEAVSVPEEPWTREDLEGGVVQVEELCRFMQCHAEEEFLAKYEVPDPAAVITTVGVQASDAHTVGDQGCSDLFSRMIEAYQSLYITESFKKVNYSEPAARETRLGKQRYGVVGAADIDNGALDFLMPSGGSALHVRSQQQPRAIFHHFNDYWYS